MSYHASETRARKWLQERYTFAHKLSNSEPVDFFVALFGGDSAWHCRLVEVKSTRKPFWRLREKNQVQQLEALKKYSKETGVPVFYLIDFKVRKKKGSRGNQFERVWRFVSLEEVEKKGKVTA